MTQREPFDGQHDDVLSLREARQADRVEAMLNGSYHLLHHTTILLHQITEDFQDLSAMNQEAYKGLPKHLHRILDRYLWEAAEKLERIRDRYCPDYKGK